MATAEEKRKAIVIRNELDNNFRRYRYDAMVGNTYDKDYQYFNQDIKLRKFAQDEVGAVSDCYLMFAVATLGVADSESIRLFLGALHNRHKELSISDMSDQSKDAVRGRLKKLVGTGFLFRHCYVVNSIGVLKEPTDENISLYTIPKSSQAFINNKLDRNTVIQDWIQAKPVYVLEGWAAASYVSSRIAQRPNYIEQKQGVFKTAAIGTANIANILKLANPEDDTKPFYVGFMYSYRHFNTAIQTREDYDASCTRLMFLIKQFFFYMDNKSHVTRLVVVCEDNSDLVEMKNILTSTVDLVDDFDRILFTGEALIRKYPKEDTSFKNCFLRIKKGKAKGSVDFVPVTPDFLV